MSNSAADSLRRHARRNRSWTIIAFSKLIGREDLIGDERYATPDARLQREAEVDAIVTGWTKERTKAGGDGTAERYWRPGGRGS